MAFLDTKPSAAAHDWNTEYSAIIPYVARQLLQMNKVACPTLRILLDAAQKEETGPDDKVSYNFSTEMYGVHKMAKNQRFSLEDIEVASRMEYTMKDWYVAAATNSFERVKYGRTNRSLVDVVDEKVQLMHTGATWVMDWLLFSNWSETISSQEISLATALSSARVPPSTSFKDITAHGDRIYSIPMVIREVTTGHTFGNIAVTTTTNKFWHPVVSKASGATVTQDSTAWATTHEQTDVVTAITNTQALDIDAVRSHLNLMQIGAGWDLYCACPADLYDVLVSYLEGVTQRAPSDPPLLDLGITASVRWESYNVTFYVDPMMTWLWPNSLFFYDPSCLFLTFDPAFNPRVVPWAVLPGTNQECIAAYWEGQLACNNRQGVGAMHGYKA